jgi:hypothetical protein
VGTFEEAARPGFEPVWWVEPERAEVELLIEAVLEVVLEVVLEADVAEGQRDDA